MGIGSGISFSITGVLQALSNIRTSVVDVGLKQILGDCDPEQGS
jgi:hypothetical protein